MSLIGWGATSGPQTPPGPSGFAAENQGAITGGTAGYSGGFCCAVIGAFTTLEFIGVWSPVAADASPFGDPPTPSNLGGGVVQYTPGYAPPDFSAGSGTLVITALVNGVLTENELVLVTARVTDFPNYGNAAWSSRTRGDGFWTRRVGTTETA